MKPGTILNNRLLIVLLTALLTAGLISWDYQQTPQQFAQSIIDTTPKKKTYDRDKIIRNLDDVLEELDAADFTVNMENIKKELTDAMKSINSEKIKLEIEQAMKQVDMEKIRKEIQTSLTKVDFSKIQSELTEAMKNIDMAKIQNDVQESIAKMNLDHLKGDWSKMKTSLEKIKDIDLKKIHEELKELSPKIEKELKKAKKEIEKAKGEIIEYKKFVDGLDSDGLIDKKVAFKLKHEDGELFINSEKASQTTYRKYRSFLEKHKKFNINIKDGKFKFDID